MSNTKLIIQNNVVISEAMHFILFQEPMNPSLDTEIYVWQRKSAQSGGKANFDIPFEVTYTATVDGSESAQLAASNGDVLIVTRDSQSDAPVLKKDLTQSDPKGAGRNYAKIINQYDKPADIIADCKKGGRPLIRQIMKVRGDSAQFDVYPFVYLAWDSDLQEGDTFKTGQYAGKSTKINFALSTGNPASEVKVKVISVGNDIKVGDPELTQ